MSVFVSAENQTVTILNLRLLKKLFILSTHLTFHTFNLTNLLMLKFKDWLDFQFNIIRRVKDFTIATNSKWASITLGTNKSIEWKCTLFFNATRCVRESQWSWNWTELDLNWTSWFIQLQILWTLIGYGY